MPTRTPCISVRRRTAATAVFRQFFLKPTAAVAICAPPLRLPLATTTVSRRKRRRSDDAGALHVRTVRRHIEAPDPEAPRPTSPASVPSIDADGYDPVHVLYQGMVKLPHHSLLSSKSPPGLLGYCEGPDKQRTAEKRQAAAPKLEKRQTATPKLEKRQTAAPKMEKLRTAAHKLDKRRTAQQQTTTPQLAPHDTGDNFQHDKQLVDAAFSVWLVRPSSRPQLILR